MLGALPAGTHRGNAHMIRDAAAAAPVEALWRQIKRDRVEQWLQPVGADAGRLRRNELELVVRPGSSSERAYRVSLENASQPIQDLLAATAKLHTDTRM
jgi:hypothetical protein